MKNTGSLLFVGVFCWIGYTVSCLPRSPTSPTINHDQSIASTSESVIQLTPTGEIWIRATG